QTRPASAAASSPPAEPTGHDEPHPSVPASAMYQTNSSRLSFHFCCGCCRSSFVVVVVAFLVVIPEGDLLLSPLHVSGLILSGAKPPRHFAFVPAGAHSAAGSPHTTTNSPQQQHSNSPQPQ